MSHVFVYASVDTKSIYKFYKNLNPFGIKIQKGFFIPFGKHNKELKET